MPYLFLYGTFLCVVCLRGGPIHVFRARTCHFIWCVFYMVCIFMWFVFYMVCNHVDICMIRVLVDFYMDNSYLIYIVIVVGFWRPRLTCLTRFVKHI